MNLTKLHKQAIVSAVIADIPRAHKDPSGDMQKILDADIAAHAPAEIAVIWGKKELAHYLHISQRNIVYFVDDKKGYGSWGSPLDHVVAQHPVMYQKSKACGDALQKLFDEMFGEAQAIKAAELKLAGTLAGLRTRKQFVTMFPELEKYAPEELTVGTNLPAIANLMTDLSKLGWPKQKEAA